MVKSKPSNYQYINISPSRIPSFDVYSVGLKKHYVTALLEFDVTESRKKIREKRRGGAMLSFNAWLIKVISDSLEKYPEVAAFRINKRKMIRFKDINISMVVEKELGDEKVPIPVVIEKCNEKTAEEITAEIEEAKNQVMTENDVVLRKKATTGERLYYKLPGFLRRRVWHYMLNHPGYAFMKMGNVAYFSQTTFCSASCSLPIISLYNSGLLAFTYLCPPARVSFSGIMVAVAKLSSNERHSAIISPKGSMIMEQPFFN